MALLVSVVIDYMPNELTSGNGTKKEAAIHVMISTNATFSFLLSLIDKYCFMI